MSIKHRLRYNLQFLHQACYRNFCNQKVISVKAASMRQTAGLTERSGWRCANLLLVERLVDSLLTDT